MLHVHLQFDLTPDQIRYLKTLLDGTICLTVGETPQPARFTILVHGFPRREDLLASPNLHTLIIPWAGPPLETLRLAAQFPWLQVHNLPYNAAPTAEMAVALLLAAAKGILPYDRKFREHRWGPPHPGRRNSVLLEGAMALILGYGRVGRRVAEALRGLGMEVRALRRERRPDDPDHVYGPQALPELLPQAAALVICLPHTPETTGLIGARELALLPPQAVLVNVARGEIVDQAALYHALAERRIFAAGIDVWYHYPDRAQRQRDAPVPPAAFPFHQLDNVVMSPHRAGWSEESEDLRLRHLAAALNAAARGQPLPHRIDPARGY
ncbi:NAD(P)-dependent oxidoreductase [Candidatus Methylocalor cossyra]|uniref:D-3-phosphoglycerate dehydrogenase n=1 Tax=Candidatus Methylocalor cossyra TaxID=3108543 RepID=A0ABP1C649_9GAMM